MSRLDTLEAWNLGFTRYGDTSSMEAMLFSFPDLVDFAMEVRAAAAAVTDYASESDRISEALRILETS